MALGTPTSLVATGSSTDATSYTTASISPSANALLLLFVSNGHATTAPAPSSISGGTLGLTWTQIVTADNASLNLRGTWYWAATTGSPPTGTITINFGSTQSSCQWHVTQILGADLTSPIVQSQGDWFTATDNPGWTLSTLQSGSATLGANCWNNTTALPVGSGYTQLSASPSATTPTIISSVEYKLPGATLVDWTTTSNLEKAIFAIEVKEGSSNAAPVPNAGADQTDKEPYSTITLDGSATDDGTVASLVWSQTAGSPSVTLSSSGNDPCTFEAPGTIAGTTLTFRLRATDNLGVTGDDTMTVAVSPVTERAAIGGVEVPMKVQATA